ncbi:trypsin-like serine peptidase [Chloroflexota bacterium]
MIQNRIRLSTVIIIILLVALFSVGAIDSQVAASSAAQLFQTAADQNGGGEISAKTNSTEWLAATRPWTKERMLAAQPYPLVTTEGQLTLSTELTEPVGKPGLKPSSPPEGLDIPSIAEESFEISSAAYLLGYSYPPPYTRFKNFDSYQVFPYSTIGVLFFSQYGVDYRCSAASIGKDAVWTAGHCIHTGDGTEGGWSEDVIFVPAYKNGEAPFGVWTAYNTWTKGSWYSSKDLRFDMGGAVLNTNSSGKMISQVVGNLGFSYNLNSSIELWFNFGYPSEAPFDGRWQYICTGPFAYDDPVGPNLNTPWSPPYPVGMGCDMTRGSSGGPWIKDFSGVAGSANFLNGNTSYRHLSNPEELFSPYFGDAAKTLWNQLMGITERLLLPIVMK